MTFSRAAWYTTLYCRSMRLSKQQIGSLRETDSGAQTGGNAMKKWARERLPLLLVLLAGMIAAVVIVAGRAEIERSAQTYDLLADYTSLLEMAEQSDESVDFWLSYLHELGVDRVAVTDTTPENLSEDSGRVILARPAAEVKDEYRWEEKYPAAVTALLEQSRGSEQLFVTRDGAAFRWLTRALESRSDAPCQTLEADGAYFVWLGDGESSDALAGIDLGVWPETEARILASGMKIVPRPSLTKGANGRSQAEAFLLDLERYESPYFINNGKVFLGDDDPDSLERIAEYIQHHDVAVGIVERQDQSLVLTTPGQDRLLAMTGNRAVRVFSMWPFVQCSWAKYSYSGPEEITNCLYRAAYERTCRVLYLKMIYMDENCETYITDPEAYARLIGDLQERMTLRGWEQAVVSANPDYNAGGLLRLIVGFGAVAAAVLLLDAFVSLKNKWRWILLGAGCICVAGAMYAAPNLSKLLLSMGGGIVMACLAAVATDRLVRSRLTFDAGLGKTMGVALLAALLGAAVSMGGALFASSALSETAFMLETRLYRGVKIMQLIPICVSVMAYFFLLVWKDYLYPKVSDSPITAGLRRRETRRSAWGELMEQPFKLAYAWEAVLLLLAVMVLGVVGIYYISRTGNASAGVSTLELELRNFMENGLPARPRTKEFLIGTPFLMLLAWGYARRMPRLSAFFAIGAAIGFTSIVNTFLHIRTPFMLSLIRVAIGLGMGMLVGVAAILALEALRRVLARAARRHNG